MSLVVAQRKSKDITTSETTTTTHKQKKNTHIALNVRDTNANILRSGTSYIMIEHPGVCIVQSHDARCLIMHSVSLREKRRRWVSSCHAICRHIPIFSHSMDPMDDDGDKMKPASSSWLYD